MHIIDGNTFLCSVEVVSILHRHALGHVIDLVYTDEPLSQLEHVVPQRNHDELCVLRTFFDI